VDKYTWVDIGSSFLAPDYVAAFLIAQLEEYDAIQAKRKFVWDSYATQLIDWAREVGATLPTIPDYAEHTSHLFWLTLNEPDQRRGFMKFIKDRGIGSTFHYQSLALSPAGKRFGRTHGTPVSDRTAETLVRLPLFAEMTEQMVNQVTSAVLEWKP